MNIFKEFAEILLEDVRKFGFIDEDGFLFIDDGIQKVLIGHCSNQVERRCE